MSGNLFNYPRINKSAHTKNVRKLINPRINVPMQKKCHTKKSGNLFHILVSINVILKKSGYLFNKSRLETYLMILISIKVPIQRKSGKLFHDHRINEPIRIKSGNLFNDTRIHKSAHTKNVWKRINLRINVPIRKKSGNLFNDPDINKSAHTKKSGNIQKTRNI